jgi:hypothetical protein
VIANIPFSSASSCVVHETRKKKKALQQTTRCPANAAARQVNSDQKHISGNATSMIGLCQEGKSSPDALGRSAGVNSFGFFAAHLGLSPCGSFVEEEPDFHLLAQL